MCSVSDERPAMFNATLKIYILLPSHMLDQISHYFFITEKILRKMEMDFF